MVDKDLADDEVNSVRSKIVGITFEDRMLRVKELKQGEQLFLSREKDNDFDQNAVRVNNKAGLQLGYLKKELASEFARRMDSGNYVYECFVKEITGGEEKGKYNLGVNIIVVEKVKNAKGSDSKEL
jgi:hypothetical protein